MPYCAQVAVDNAAFKFDRLYSYTVPDVLSRTVRVGSRVLVPFGAAAPRMGVVLEFSEQDSADGLRSIIDCEKGEPSLSPEMVELIFYLKRQTLCTYYDAVRTVLPKNSRLVAKNGDESTIGNYSTSHLVTAIRRVDGVVPRLTDRQREVYDALNEPMSFSELNEKIGASRDIVNRLIGKNILEKVEIEKKVELYSSYRIAGNEIELTEPQQSALDEIRQCIKKGSPAATLLHGVTSSGKTVIYEQLCLDTLAEGHSAMVLVPEIAIATQMIYRFKERFGERVGVIHSALSDTERQLQWRKIRDGEYDVVIGTRSAVFAPLLNIGIIIVDEEQEQSYCSDRTPRYSAIPIAAFRASKHSAHLLLASATPSVESYYKAVSGSINLVTLDRRYMDMPLPSVRVVDMRKELFAGNTSGISEHLRREIQMRLDRKEQSILLLNRRGYRTVSICVDCKKILKCKSCDTALVYHKNINRYICHCCGAVYPISDECPDCGGQIRRTGIGTQRVEEELTALFPTARVLRIDLDSTGGKHSIEQLLGAFSRGEYDIIIGTQMIAKGLDFGNVTLVGVLGIDRLMLMPSFRANEHTFSMLTQVIGRAGRGDKEGEAVIQTVDPDNPIIRLAAKQDYNAFYNDEIVSRKVHLYPPYCAVGTVGFVAAKEQDALAAAQQFVELLKSGVEGKKIAVRVLGPVPMRIAFANDMYRYKLTVKYNGGREFKEILSDAVYKFGNDKRFRDITLFVDLVGDSEQ